MLRVAQGQRQEGEQPQQQEVQPEQAVEGHASAQWTGKDRHEESEAAAAPPAADGLTVQPAAAVVPAAAPGDEPLPPALSPTSSAVPQLLAVVSSVMLAVSSAALLVPVQLGIALFGLAPGAADVLLMRLAGASLLAPALAASALGTQMRRQSYIGFGNVLVDESDAAGGASANTSTSPPPPLPIAAIESSAPEDTAERSYEPAVARATDRNTSAVSLLKWNACNRVADALLVQALLSLVVTSQAVSIRTPALIWGCGGLSAAAALAAVCALAKLRLPPPAVHAVLPLPGITGRSAVDSAPWKSKPFKQQAAAA